MRRHPLIWLGQLAFLLFAYCAAGSAEAPPPPDLDPAAQDALRLIASSDAYQQELGFLRLEALRDPGTLPAILPYTDNPDAQMRAWSLRAVAAIQGEQAIPMLTQHFKTDRSADVRREILLGLEPYAKTHQELLELFLGALTDRQPQVRMTAADIVSRIDDPAADKAIRDRRRREHRKDVRRVLDMAIQRINAR